MGVPALFRWLSKKYPKIVEPVLEDLPAQKQVEGGFEEIPIDMSQTNPNGMEFDNLYLDMNGIVHPCTHPEGKKAPETEEEMMIEVFKYTERVVNMVRPRKLLMIAIDGVAPRAKMNQQRSRRFRAAQEAKVKQQEKQALIDEYIAIGKELTEDLKSNKKAWDSNAITPGTPFMTLLTESLRYWIVYKMNTDKGWSQIQVILSDASVPGEGEHKIMDFVRRQRSHPEYDPNTKHVIYGLDADLIMLSLACHEPHFKVLREDVFLDQNKGKCFTCGQSGHLSSQCQGKAKEKADEYDIKQKPVERKPFIFLDVGTLREYLALELNLGGLPFPFDLERAIDDWVLLIFFVGNDFLPHLPSLEIREGAIDTLLKIWKNNLASMGGYLTNCGTLNLKRTGIILEGLAAREDDIFRKRREAETRQDQNAKRRKIESESPRRPHVVSSSRGQDYQSSSNPLTHSTHNLPAKPIFSPPNVNPTTSSSIPGLGVTSLSMMSNADVVNNRFAIRTANMDAAAMLKAELSGALQLPTPTEASNGVSNQTSDSVLTESRSPKASTKEPPPTSNQPDAEVSGTTGHDAEPVDRKVSVNNEAVPTNSETVPNSTIPAETINPQKRKADEVESSDLNIGATEDEVVLSEDDEDDAPPEVSVLIPGQPSRPAPLTMLGNNMVEQEDTVKLWEPGYRERYFRQKFGIELSDEVEKRKIVKHYVEGLAWVLAYYYRGCPSWQWFYPYHYSPFAADFINLEEFDIKFTMGAPSKPYEQLMGVFPTASLIHIPDVYHHLMLNDESPIKDFYPEEFEIDMNGKKMLWQGIALLPFIEQDRLLASMKELEDQLSEKDKSRNQPGDVVMFCGQAHPQYENFCQIYQKRDTKVPVTLNPANAKGVFGSALPDPSCIPGSTFHSPLPTVGLPDISNDKSIFARFFVPSQLVPHRSSLLQGVKIERRMLNNYDRDSTRRGGDSSYGGGGGGGYSSGNGFHQQRRDFGDGPGVISHYQSNPSRGGGGGHWNSSRGTSHHHQQQQQRSYSNNYRWPPVEANNRAGPIHSHSNNYASNNHSSTGGYSNGPRGSVPYPSTYGGHPRGGGYGVPTPPYDNNGPMPGGGHGGRYGGTGIGSTLPPPPHSSAYQYHNPSNNHNNAGAASANSVRGARPGGYRPPGIVPAVTRPVVPHHNSSHHLNLNQNHQLRHPPPSHSNTSPSFGLPASKSPYHHSAK